MKTGTDFISLEKAATLAGFVTDRIIRKCSQREIDYFLQNKSVLEKKIIEALALEDYVIDRWEWQKFYKNQFNLTVDFTETFIPIRPSKGDWILLFLAKGLTCNYIYDAWPFAKKREHEDLNEAISRNKRDPENGHYAIWVRTNIDPDIEFRDKEVRNIDPNTVMGITLLERMLLESKFFFENKTHLDPRGVTFCSGSVYMYNYVPHVRFINGKVSIYLGFTASSGERSGIREVVS